MDWWVIEYDNKNFDSHVFMSKVQDEFAALMVTAGGGPFGATVYNNSATTASLTCDPIMPEAKGPHVSLRRSRCSAGAACVTRYTCYTYLRGNQ